jgi:hypothetical protein
VSVLLNLRNAFRQFHENEEGLEALQVVMIIAVAALCLILVKFLYKDYIQPWLQKLIENITGWKDATQPNDPT